VTYTPGLTLVAHPVVDRNPTSPRDSCERGGNPVGEFTLAGPGFGAQVIYQLVVIEVLSDVGPIVDFSSDWVHQVWVCQVHESLGPRPPQDTPVPVQAQACAPDAFRGRVAQPG